MLSKKLLYQLDCDTIHFYVIRVMALIPVNSYFNNFNFYFFLCLPSLCSPMSPLVLLLVPFAGLLIFCCPLSNLFLGNRKLLPCTSSPLSLISSLSVAVAPGYLISSIHINAFVPLLFILLLSQPHFTQ